MASTKAPALRRFCMILLAIVMIFSLLPVHALASSSGTEFPPDIPEWNYTLTGKERSDRFELKSSDSQIFDLEDLIPGDSCSGKIHIKNATREKMEASIISIVSNLSDNTLYDTLHLMIEQEGETVYDGPYGKTSSPISSFYLIKRGETLTFDVTVTLPETAGNEVVNKKMDSTWTFEARYYDRARPSQYPYEVNYIDEDGNKLLPSKHSWGFLGERVTEEYEKIKGYKVDREEKSITIRTKDNVIDFIYKQTGKKNVDTGIDLTGSNTGSGMWLLFFGIYLGGGSLIGLMILDAKNHAAKTTQNSSSNKEADPKNED